MNSAKVREDEEREKRDEEWLYDVDDPIALEEIENDEMDTSGGSLATFLPFIEYDHKERTLNFSRRLR